MTNRSLVSSRTARTNVTEDDAFADLYQDEVHPIFNYCLYRVHDPAAAEDLTADVFERAWRARHRYNPHRGDFSTWLFAIARRRVADWLRRQHRHSTVFLDEQLESSLPGPAPLAVAADERRRLRQLVQDLPADAQELIAMKFGAGMTNRHIAEVLGKSETAIGSALCRVVRKLRLQWEETR